MQASLNSKKEVVFISIFQLSAFIAMRGRVVEMFIKQLKAVQAQGDKK